MQEKRHRPEPVRRTGLSDRHRKWGKETTVKRGLSLLVGLAVAAAPGLASAETTLRLAHMNSPTHFVNTGAMAMAKAVEERTTGEVRIAVYPSGQPAAQTQITHQT